MPPFPHGKPYPNYEPIDITKEVEGVLYAQGMTLRDYFAGQLICGLAESLSEDDDLAQYAYAIADAMLAERTKRV